MQLITLHDLHHAVRAFHGKLSLLHDLMKSFLQRKCISLHDLNHSRMEFHGKLTLLNVLACKLDINCNEILSSEKMYSIA